MLPLPKDSVQARMVVRTEYVPNENPLTINTTFTKRRFVGGEVKVRDLKIRAEHPAFTGLERVFVRVLNDGESSFQPVNATPAVDNSQRVAAKFDGFGKDGYFANDPYDRYVVSSVEIAADGPLPKIRVELEDDGIGDTLEAGSFVPEER